MWFLGDRPSYIQDLLTEPTTGPSGLRGKGNVLEQPVLVIWLSPFTKSYWYWRPKDVKSRNARCWTRSSRAFQWLLLVRKVLHDGIQCIAYQAPQKQTFFENRCISLLHQIHMILTEHVQCFFVSYCMIPFYHVASDLWPVPPKSRNKLMILVFSRCGMRRDMGSTYV